MDEPQEKTSANLAPAPTVEKVAVKRLDVILAEHGMDPGDEFVGPERGRYFLDYGGEPEVLADSRRLQDRTEHEDALWEQLRSLVKT